jgi:hypothetical protein
MLTGRLNFTAKERLEGEGAGGMLVFIAMFSG